MFEGHKERKHWRVGQFCIRLVSSPEKCEHLNSSHLYLLCLTRTAFKHDCITPLFPPTLLTKPWKQFTELHLENSFWKTVNVSVIPPQSFDFYRQKNTSYVTWTVHCKEDSKHLLDEWNLKFPQISYCNKKK